MSPTQCDLVRSDPRLGGHTDSHTVLLSEQVYSVDTGFVAFNNAIPIVFCLAATAGCDVPTSSHVAQRVMP